MGKTGNKEQSNPSVFYLYMVLLLLCSGGPVMQKRCVLSLGMDSTSLAFLRVSLWEKDPKLGWHFPISMEDACCKEGALIADF